MLKFVSKQFKNQLVGVNFDFWILACVNSVLRFIKCAVQLLTLKDVIKQRVIHAICNHKDDSECSESKFIPH